DPALRLLSLCLIVPRAPSLPLFPYTTLFRSFGQAGAADVTSAVRPRFQTGVRYRPNEIFSVDVIYGRNITGENANWITIGTTVRFPAPESPVRERTGHL